ncbi:MAG: NUDIX domain-containing protein [Clostridia bacterium]|nr:NUDIX domain-containing protein [Clostridia bacterium]
MKIRNSIKAIIIKGTKLLVVHLKTPDGEEYYTLPGGKQEPDELMIDTLKREVREETGYEVEPKSLLFIREGYNGESHRIEFMFICETIGEPDETALEYDVNQVGVKWLSIDNILHEELYPVSMRNVIKRHFLGKSNEVYLGEME